jgi:arylsulfatase A-like enzyme
MIISDPSHPDRHGTSTSHITELVDLYPTLTDLCGLSGRQPAILQGESLAGIIEEGAAPNKGNVAYTTTKAGRASTIRSDRWRYTRWGEEAAPSMEELYDHLNDPEELQNLADQPDFRDELQQMRNSFEKARQTAREGTVSDSKEAGTATETSFIH